MYSTVSPASGAKNDGQPQCESNLVSLRNSSAPQARQRVDALGLGVGVLAGERALGAGLAQHARTRPGSAPARHSSSAALHGVRTVGGLHGSPSKAPHECALSLPVSVTSRSSVDVRVNRDRAGPFPLGPGALPPVTAGTSAEERRPGVDVQHRDAEPIPGPTGPVAVERVLDRVRASHDDHLPGAVRRDRGCQCGQRVVLRDLADGLRPRGPEGGPRRPGRPAALVRAWSSLGSRPRTASSASRSSPRLTWSTTSASRLRSVSAGTRTR